MRILYTTVSTAIFTALFFVAISSAYIFLTETPLDGFFGGRFFIVATGIIGLIVGCISGFIIGWINKNITISAIIGGIVYFIAGIFFMGKVPTESELPGTILSIIIPTFFAGLSCGIAAKLFNTKQ